MGARTNRADPDPRKLDKIGKKSQIRENEKAK